MSIDRTPSPHAFTVHSLHDTSGQDFGSWQDVGGRQLGTWLHDPAISGRAIYEWVLDVMAFHGFSEAEIEWCEADDAVPYDHGRLKATGEVIATLHLKHIHATQPLSTHERAAKMLEAA